MTSLALEADAEMEVIARGRHLRVSRRATAEDGAAARAVARRATALIVPVLSSSCHEWCRAVQVCRRRAMRNARTRREDVFARAFERDSESTGATDTSGRIKDGRRRRRCARRVCVAYDVDVRGARSPTVFLSTPAKTVVARIPICEGL